MSKVIHNIHILYILTWDGNIGLKNFDNAF